jgi:hypothetical protein
MEEKLCFKWERMYTYLYKERAPGMTENNIECTDKGVAILVEMSVDGDRGSFKMLYQFYHQTHD